MFPVRLFTRSCKKVMEKIADISLEPCTNSRFVQPYRVKFNQDGQQRFWDCTKIHNSVAVLIFNRTKKTFVLVKQFRPAVYMSKHRHLWENSGVFTTALSQKPPPQQTTDGSEETQQTTDGPEAVPPPAKKAAITSPQTGQTAASPTSRDEPDQQPPPDYGPGTLGCTYELCAGIVDKQVPLAQIAKEEILEETGYDVPVENLELINSFYSSMGHAGSHQSVYYCEVTEEMLVHQGGGNGHEGEMIDVVHVPVSEAMELAFDRKKPRSTGLCFAFVWFEHFKRPKLGL